jgi:hypothetical protein
MLALVIVALLVTPFVAVAASGLPPTISLAPESAAAGSVVEVTGLDFPAGQPVEVQVTTTAGVATLATVTTEEGGYFRQAVTLPADAPPGFWELRATAPDGSVAVHMFEAAPAAAVAVEAPPQETSTSGNSLSDIVVMLIFALVIAGVGGGIWYVWYMSRLGDRQPGMSLGEDPIWSSGHTEIDPSFLATKPSDERRWGPAQGKS